MTDLALHRTVPAHVPRADKRKCVCVIALVGLAVGTVMGGYLAAELPRPGGLLSLLLGFGPLIGWFVGLVAVTLLFSLLTCSIADKFFADDDDVEPEVGLRRRWQRSRVCISDLYGQYLALKEHSPPAAYFS